MTLIGKEKLPDLEKLMYKEGSAGQIGRAHV